LTYRREFFLHRYWSNEFALFYDPDNGVDIDGVWIDMNEPASVSFDFPMFPGIFILKLLHSASSVLILAMIHSHRPFSSNYRQNVQPHRLIPTLPFSVTATSK